MREFQPAEEWPNMQVGELCIAVNRAALQSPRTARLEPAGCSPMQNVASELRRGAYDGFMEER